MARRGLSRLSVLSGLFQGLERGISRGQDLKLRIAASELKKQQRQEDVLFRQQQLATKRTEEQRIAAQTGREEASIQAAETREDARREADRKRQEAADARQAQKFKQVNLQNKVKEFEKKLAKGGLSDPEIEEFVARQNELADLTKTTKFETFRPDVPTLRSQIPVIGGAFDLQTKPGDLSVRRVESTFGQDQPTSQEQFTPAPPSETIQPTSIQQPTFEDAAFKEFEKGAITVEKLIELAPNIPVFNSVEEAEAANVPPGTQVVIGGRPAIAG